jgi:hypothetical protein
MRVVTHSSADRRSGKPLSMTASNRSRKAWLLQAERSDASLSDKNGRHQREMIIPKVPYAARGSPRRNVEPRCRGRNRRWRKSHQNKNLMASRRENATGKRKRIWMLTGDCSPQRVFGIQTRWFERVHVRTANPFNGRFGVPKRKSKASLVSDHERRF